MYVTIHLPIDNEIVEGIIESGPTDPRGVDLLADRIASIYVRDGLITLRYDTEGDRMVVVRPLS